MINNCIFTGRLTKDVDLKYTQNNTPMISFNLAVNRSKPNQNNEYETDFPMFTVFGKQAENMARFLQRGSLIGVEAEVRTSTYKDKSGNNVYSTNFQVRKITFLESKKQNQGNNNNQNFGYNQKQGNYQNNNNQHRQNQNNNQRGYNQNNNFDSFGYDFMNDDELQNVVNPFNE